jgi:hypothetical protein
MTVMSNCGRGIGSEKPVLEEMVWGANLMQYKPSHFHAGFWKQSCKQFSDEYEADIQGPFWKQNGPNKVLSISRKLQDSEQNRHKQIGLPTLRARLEPILERKSADGRSRS